MLHLRHDLERNVDVQPARQLSQALAVGQPCLVGSDLDVDRREAPLIAARWLKTPHSQQRPHHQPNYQRRRATTPNPAASTTFIGDFAKL